MKAPSRWHVLYRVGGSGIPVAAASGAVVGGILALVTIILAAANAVSAQQAIALALPATIITIAGLIRTVIPDSWSAWRRGFQQGCEVALMYPRDPPYPGGAVAPSGPKPLGPHPFPPAAR